LWLLLHHLMMWKQLIRKRRYFQTSRSACDSSPCLRLLRIRIRDSSTFASLMKSEWQCNMSSVSRVLLTWL
jgi:hypothetical protein